MLVMKITLHNVCLSCRALLRAALYCEPGSHTHCASSVLPVWCVVWFARHGMHTVCAKPF